MWKLNLVESSILISETITTFKTIKTNETKNINSNFNKMDIEAIIFWKKTTSHTNNNIQIEIFFKKFKKNMFIEHSFLEIN